jgi:outer membrane protein assembly factor BamD (BamD/ComL family)
LDQARAELRQAEQLTLDRRILKSAENLRNRIRKQEIADERGRQRKLQQRADALYRQAVALYRSKDYENALTKFQEVENTLPGYSKTHHYIKQIPHDTESHKEQLKLKELKSEIDSLYKEAEALFRQDNLAQAKDRFSQVLSLDPGHRHAKQYLERRIPDKIKRQQQEAERTRIRQERLKERALRQKADALYRQAVALYRNKDFENALIKFQEVENTLSGYSKTHHYIKQIPHDTESHKEQLKLKELKGKADTLYSDAVNLYQNKDYDNALIRFEQVCEVMPDHRGANSYINRILKDIETNKKQELKRQEQEKQRLEREREQAEREEKRQELIRQQQEEKKRQQEERDRIGQQQEAERARIRQEQEQERARIQKEQEQGKERIRQERLKEQALKKQIASLYKEAISAYRQDNLEHADTLFSQILSLEPSHRHAKDYLENRIPRRMQQAEAQRQIQEKQDTIRRKQEAMGLYKEAIGLYQNKDYDNAIVKFEQVAELWPGHTGARHYIDHIFEHIKLQKEQALKAQHYQDDWPIQQKTEHKIQKETDRRLMRRQVEAEKAVTMPKPVEHHLPAKKEQVYELRHKPIKQAPAVSVYELYSQGVRLYMYRDYESAYEKFRQVQALAPGYDRVDFYIKSIPESVKKKTRGN